MDAHFRCLLVSCVVSILATSADAAEWKKHRYTADGFEVEFSGAITVIETPVSAETKKQLVRATTYTQDGGDFVYVSAASLNKAGVNFEKGSDASFAALKCKSKTKDVPLTVAGGRGRELAGTDCHDGNYRAETRYFTKANWFYQAITLFKKDGGDVESARYFLRSFKILGN